ncbi:YifB family Mg chelatase-like AAA ATPase [Neomicrococcus aestuarii]|uniref:YifB family Mg chelatase-like AAA ATPase n=1 Tax=Neomicrococcus aestuarii TaxID=556325 RepID=UPI00160E6D3A
MSLGRSLSVSLVGLEGYVIEVQADVGGGLPAFVLLGLPDASLTESRDRVRSAARNIGLPLSPRRLTVNLMPAALPKRGTAFDVPILLSALMADNVLTVPPDIVFLGELTLDGFLRPVPGVLPAVVAAQASGIRKFAVPAENLAEAQLAGDVDVRGFQHVCELLTALGVDPQGLTFPNLSVREHSLGSAAGTDGTVAVDESSVAPDLADVDGQAHAKFALQVAAAGAHHLMMVGAPGSGKTMIAERLPTILPDLDLTESLESTSIHSLSMGGKPIQKLITRPPFVSPHHSASMAAMVGGGSGIPRPGAISKAHRGVLFLDEAPEFQTKTLDALRQPLEQGKLTIHRATGAAEYPARFQLVLAANPCPCGLFSGTGSDCTCRPDARRRYFARLSGPLLDRIDIRVDVQPQTRAQQVVGARTERITSAQTRERVQTARLAQAERWASLGISTNAEVPGSLLRGAFAVGSRQRRPLDRASDQGKISGRGYDRVLRIAWTLCDLDGTTSPDEDHIHQALTLRQGMTL